MSRVVSVYESKINGKSIDASNVGQFGVLLERVLGDDVLQVSTLKGKGNHSHIHLSHSCRQCNFVRKSTLPTDRMPLYTKEQLHVRTYVYTCCKSTFLTESPHS